MTLLTASLCWPLEEKLDNPSFDKSVSLGNRLFVLMGTTTQSARNFVFFFFFKTYLQEGFCFCAVAHFCGLRSTRRQIKTCNSSAAAFKHTERLEDGEVYAFVYDSKDAVY